MEGQSREEYIGSLRRYYKLILLNIIYNIYIYKSDKCCIYQARIDDPTYTSTLDDTGLVSKPVPTIKDPLLFLGLARVGE